VGSETPTLLGFGAICFTRTPASVLACFPTVIHLFSGCYFRAISAHAWLRSGRSREKRENRANKLLEA
jgi:hypothetical protein